MGVLRLMDTTGYVDRTSREIVRLSVKESKDFGSWKYNFKKMLKKIYVKSKEKKEIKTIQKQMLSIS